MNSTLPGSARVTVDRYVLETLMPDLVGHDRRPSSFLVYLFLWGTTSGGRTPVELSLRHIADGTGISKRAVQNALLHLARRRLLSIDRVGATAVARLRVHRPWQRESSAKRG